MVFVAVTLVMAALVTLITVMASITIMFAIAAAFKGQTE